MFNINQLSVTKTFRVVFWLIVLILSLAALPNFVVLSKSNMREQRILVQVLVANLNIYSGPDATYKVLETIHKGGKIALSSISPDALWFGFKYANGYGWIQSDKSFTTFLEGRQEDLPILDDQPIETVVTPTTIPELTNTPVPDSSDTLPADITTQQQLDAAIASCGAQMTTTEFSNLAAKAATYNQFDEAFQLFGASTQLLLKCPSSTAFPVFWSKWGTIGKKARGWRDFQDGYQGYFSNTSADMPVEDSISTKGAPADLNSEQRFNTLYSGCWLPNPRSLVGEEFLIPIMKAILANNWTKIAELNKKRYGSRCKISTRFQIMWYIVKTSSEIPYVLNKSQSWSDFKKGWESS